MITRRRILLAFAALLLAAACGTGYYITTKGFFRPWRDFMAAEFEKHGLEVSLQRLTLDPFRGLVAREVKLYDAGNHRHVLASIDEMVLGINYAEAFHGRDALDWVDLHEAHVTLPLDPGDPEGTQIEASRLNARFFLPAGQIYLARAEAEILGIRVYASGRLLNPRSFPGRRPGTPEARARAVDAYNLLASLRYQEKEPVISADFSGDLAEPAEITVHARVYAPSVRRKNYTLEEVEVTAAWQRGQLDVPRLSARETHGGTLRGAVAFDARASHFSARLESTLNIAAFAKAYSLSPFLDGLTLRSAPKLDLTVTGSPHRPEEWRVFGHVAAERFAWEGVSFLGCTADVSWMPGHWSVRDLVLRQGSGRLEGDLMSVPDGFRASLRGAIDPRELSPLVSAPLARWLSRFDFADAPSLTLEIRGPSAAVESCRADGYVTFGRSTYDGAPTPNLLAHLHFGESTLSLAPFRRTANDAPDTQLVFDLKSNAVRIEKMPLAPSAEAPAHGQS